MQNIAKKQNSTLAMAFLFASLVITPLSLKALGVSLNISAGVEAWRHIAGTIADNYQPLNAAQMLALSLSTDESEGNEPAQTTSPLLASTQPLDMQLTAEPGLRICDQTVENEPVASPAPVCQQSVTRGTRVTRPASKAVVAIAPFVRVMTQTLARTQTEKALVIRQAALQEMKRALATYRINVERAEMSIPNAFKFTVNVKPSAMPKLPVITGCAQRRVLSPEQVKQLRAAAWGLTFNAAPESPEKSEL